MSERESGNRGRGRPPGGDKPFGKGRKPFGGGKRAFGEKRDYSEKRGFGEKREFGGKRSFGDKRSGEGQGPRGDRPFRDRGPRREGERGFGEKRNFGEKREFGGKRSSEGPGPRGDRPFRDRGPRREGDRPFRDKPFSRDGGGPRRDREARGDRPPRRFGDKPFRRSERDAPRPEGQDEAPKKSFRRTPADSHLAKPGSEGPARERPHLGDDELRYLGRNACVALFQKRPDDIIRVYVHRERAVEFKPIIDFCAQNRKSYHIVEDIDLERLTDSVHHQGICVVAKARRFLSEGAFFSRLDSNRALVLFLDGVANPHNLGAILRTAAHFGLRYVAVPAPELTKISPAIYRTAEGGAELVSIVRVDDSEKFLDRIQGLGFQLYAFERGPESKPLFTTRINEKSVFVFGSEVHGLSGIVRSVVESKLEIPGTGAVESLNVSVAAAIAIAEFEKQGAQRSVRIVKPKG